MHCGVLSSADWNAPRGLGHGFRAHWDNPDSGLSQTNRIRIPDRPGSTPKVWLKNVQSDCLESFEFREQEKAGSAVKNADENCDGLMCYKMHGFRWEMKPKLTSCC